MIKRNVDSTNFQIAPSKAGDGHAADIVVDVRSGAAQREYYREKLGSTIKGAGIVISVDEHIASRCER